MTADPVETMMLRSRVWFLMKQPFFGQIIMHLEMQDATEWCPTAATDGRYFYYNREFVKSLTKEELIFLHGHEILHVVLDQIFRRGTRDHAIWGMAADYIVNYILVASEIGRMPKDGLYNPHYTDDFTTEELFDLLEKSGAGAQPTLDMHLEGKSKDGTKDGGGDQQDGASGEGPPQYSESEIEAIRATMRSVMVQAAQNSNPGTLPAGIQRLLNRLTKPRLNWRQILTQVIRSTIKYDYTYTRLSRRSWSSGMILPGQDLMDKVTAVAWLDGSASTTQEMVTDFLSECKGIMSMCRDFELTIGTFDTKPYNVQVFTPQNAHKVDSYHFVGGGGTAPSCCWDYMKQHRIKPHHLLIFGDGLFGNDWGDADYCPTIFILHTNPHTKSPYGKTIHYEIK